MSETNIQYNNGVQRSTRYPRFRDIPYELTERIAKAFQEGTKYEPATEGWLPFEKNWQAGDLTFALDALDHAKRHLELYIACTLARLNGEIVPDDWEPNEDHLGNCGANLGMAAWFEKRGIFDRASYLSDNETVAYETEPVVVKEPIADKILGAFGIHRSN